MQYAGQSCFSVPTYKDNCVLQIFTLSNGMVMITCCAEENLINSRRENGLNSLLVPPHCRVC